MKAIALMLALVAVSGAPTGPREMKVTRPRASVMEKPQFWGRTLAEVTRDQKVMILDRSRNPWFKVQVKEKTGYVHSSAFEEARVSFAGAADAEDAPTTSQRTIGLAARGFNEDIEKDYRKSHPNLDAAFEAVKRYEEVDAADPTDEDMRQFTSEGALLDAPAPSTAPATVVGAEPGAAPKAKAPAAAPKRKGGAK